jgi:hypothetical protein
LGFENTFIKKAGIEQLLVKNAVREDQESSSKEERALLPSSIIVSGFSRFPPPGAYMASSAL